MARDVVRVDGLKDLDRALGELPKATAKATLRRVLKDAAEPVARTARRLAPKDDYHLHDSIDVSAKLTRRQAALHRKQGGRAFQEMFVGANDPADVQQEFGNDQHPAQPFMRPAWDAEKRGVLDHISNALWGEIEKSAKRLAKKRARAKG